DPLFQEAKRKAAARRRKQKARRLAVLAGTAAAVVAGGIGIALWSFTSSDDPAELAVGLAQVDTEVPDEIPDTVAAFVDIPGNPMILRFDDGGGGTREALAGPVDTALARFGAPAPDRFAVVREPLAAAGQRLSTSVPSSPADLALFQAYRTGALALTKEGGGEALRPDADSASASVVHLEPVNARAAPQRERVVQLRRAQALDDLLTGFDLAPDEATRVADEVAGQMALPNPLPPGSVVALRTGREAERATLLQLTAYGPGGYVGSVARTGDGLRPSADPWINQDGIAAAVAEAERSTTPDDTRPVRLLDAVYSAALRAGLPSATVGELSVMLARLHNLDRPAEARDRLDLVLAPASQGASRVAYAGIRRGQERMVCYVVPREDREGYRCHDPAASGGGIGASTAVLKLVDQIIRVESAGDPNAKNTRSTATGLGQFINKTWLRMIRTYRPDLMEALSQEEVLALRTNPQLSRQMVVHLAQENEEYLRQRHEITPGRLYLAHFLGPVDADRLLGADDAQPLSEVLNARILVANPYIADYSVKDLEDWADRKMRPRRNTRSAPLPEPDTEALRAYRAAIDAVLAQAGG
ncbi:MAG: hypothetical protein AAFQ51_13785, partial [Pseudomonadota bacterium]